MKDIYTLFIVLIVFFVKSSVAEMKDEYDILVFGATPAGFAAAIAAARSPSKPSVLFLEPTAYIGGMASPGGIGLRDCEKDYIRTNNGTQHEWGMRNAKKYDIENTALEKRTLENATFETQVRYRGSRMATR